MPAELPSKYYLNHARELFSHVNQYCAHLLETPHQDYLSGFEKLDADSQCLLIRLLARKHTFVKHSSLKYAEIDDLNTAKSILEKGGFIGAPTHQDWTELSRLMTKPELQHILSLAGMKVRASSKKEQMVEMAQSLDTAQIALSELSKWYLVKLQQDTVDYLFFLFFGDLRNRLQKFAMRDLGVLKVRKTDGDAVARFSHREHALNTFNLLRHQRDFKQCPDVFFEQACEYAVNTKTACSGSKQARDKLLLDLGLHAAQLSPERALALWQQSSAPKATERWVRLMYHHYGKDAAQAEIECLRNKANLPSASRVFIEDFYARKYLGKRTSIYTDMLRATDRHLQLDEAYINDVEEGVIGHYLTQDQQALFTENKLWRVLFAFTFWPILYTKQHSEFDRLPAPLHDLNFYQTHRTTIEERLRLLSNIGQAITEFTKLATQHYGYPTGLFRWRPDLMDMLIPCLRFAPEHAIENTLRRMTKNFEHTKDGYPDIMVVQDDTLRFEEIKAPGDVLRPNQLVSIQRLRESGFTVDVTQVEWATNPEQVYAVVDIETTGGRKSGNAITEIAVVKVQGGKIIDQWSTLVNPQKPIPRHITHLTGIDNNMVRSAPVFAEVADELKSQLRSSIFVAHNVGFDYGFIKAAYEQIGQNFRMPKYCTVRSARRAFPGLTSYSLGNLTKEFDIELRNHHRALSDATATAHLLRLIQDQPRKHA